MLLILLFLMTQKDRPIFQQMGLSLLYPKLSVDFKYGTPSDYYLGTIAEGYDSKVVKITAVLCPP